MKFENLFKTRKPLIACVHLMPLPGSPHYSGDMRKVYDTALSEVEIFLRHKVDGLIVENFRDKPFYPDKVPAETIAALASVAREIVRRVNIPVGINVLRNDACASIAIATAVEASFIRINVHMSAVVSEQGIIEGKSHETLRLRAALLSNVLIFADVGVKHAAPLSKRSLEIETKDLSDRGLVDAIIVSGELTGSETNAADVMIVKQNTALPVLIGSGATPENLHKVSKNIDGLIVGSYFKKDGKGSNLVDEDRVKKFVAAINTLKS